MNLQMRMLTFTYSRGTRDGLRFLSGSDPSLSMCFLAVCVHTASCEKAYISRAAIDS